MQRDLNIHLQELAKQLKQEVKEVLARHGVTRTTISVVQRSYAFEEPGVPHGQQWVLKVKYPASMGQLPVGLSGNLFSAIFGTTTSLAESLIVKRTIMGPSWLTLKNAVTVDPGRQVRPSHLGCRPAAQQHDWPAMMRKSGLPPHSLYPPLRNHLWCGTCAATVQVSWCAVELEVSGPKAVVTGGEVSNRDVPPLVVASLHIKTHINPSTNANEIVAVSVLYTNHAKVSHAPRTKAAWDKKRRHPPSCAPQQQSASGCCSGPLAQS